MLGLSELALLLIVVIVLIGAKKLPDLTRSAGKAARIFKSEARAMKADDSPTDGTSAPRVIKATPDDVTRKAPGAESGQG
ncbi:twin-arginine translocase TatA/TatE family subunit [Streptomyces sp. NPDC003442]